MAIVGEIEAGDVVRLKSNPNGPEMTVGSVSKSREVADCVWFDMGGTLHRAELYLAALDAVKEQNG